jgi:hypothetical protein
MINRLRLYLGVPILAIGLTGAALIRGQHPQETHGSMTQKQMEEMNERGDRQMGFSRLKTTHHFLLARDGGAIQVETNNEKDTQSRDQIRRHLRHIAMMFASGNFDTPMTIHAKTPPGADLMQQLKAEINYKFKETSRGGVIHITASNATALRAIQDFLRFQIKEHKTGDSLEAHTSQSN